MQIWPRCKWFWFELGRFDARCSRILSHESVLPIGQDWFSSISQCNLTIDTPISIKSGALWVWPISGCKWYCLLGQNGLERSFCFLCHWTISCFAQMDMIECGLRNQYLCLLPLLQCSKHYAIESVASLICSSCYHITVASHSLSTVVSATGLCTLNEIFPPTATLFSSFSDSPLCCCKAWWPLS